MNHRIYFEYLSLHNEIKNTLAQRGDLTEEKKNLIDERIAEHKKEYRAWLKRRYGKKYLYPGKDGNGYGEIVAVGGKYDSCWTKVFFPGEHWDEEEKHEFIEANWKHYKPTYYDCTGQIFTWAIDVFNLPSGVVAYIRDAMDV